jgi:hypothetical protein
MRVGVGIFFDFNCSNLGAEAMFWTKTASVVHLVTGTDKVGIGTTTVPHGSVGAAKLALDGTQASADGPHVQLTTSEDDYPVLQVLCMEHDNVQLRFDSYWDGTFSRSSDAGSNFNINKNNDLLRFQYDSGVAQGALVTYDTGLSLDTSGIVGVNQKLGIGTTAVPVGGHGGAKLAIDGTDTHNTDCAIIQLTTSDGGDAYPLLQVRGSGHDNQAVYFDCYYDGATKSSDAGSNFRLTKYNDLFYISYDSGVSLSTTTCSIFRTTPATPRALPSPGTPACRSTPPA